MALKSCSDNHGEIIYDTKDHGECPVCLLREQLDEIVDSKEDINTEDILALFTKADEQDKRIKQLEDAVFAQAPRKKFGLF